MENCGVYQPPGIGFLPPSQVLVIDDRVDNTDFIANVIAPLGVASVRAHSPDEAMTVAGNQEFAVALVSVKSPDPSAIHLARQIRELPGHQALPLIFITTSAFNIEMSYRDFDSGPVDFMQQPIPPILLRSKVSTFTAMDQIKRRLQISLEKMPALKEKAEQANRLKERFLAAISHEIRTPLAAIIGSAEVAYDDCQDPIIHELLSSVIANGRHLSNLIDDLLMISKMEADAIQMQFAPCNIGSLLSEVQNMFLHQCKAKRLELITRTPGDAGALVMTDVLRLKQIVANLVSNAIKFTEQGAVEVCARMRRKKSKGLHWSIEVKDTGPGIKSHLRKKIFQPFVQEDSSYSRHHGGTGLGLTICQKLVDHLEGTISFRNRRGGGTIFQVDIPAKPPPTSTITVKPVQEAPPPDLSKLGKVLLVEDSPHIRRFVERGLIKRGIDLTVCASGIEATRMTGDQLKEFEVVLMDLEMPGMTGFEAIVKLRSKGAKARFLAFSAHTNERERSAAARAGFDKFIAKPVHFDELIGALLPPHSVDPDRVL